MTREKIFDLIESVIDDTRAAVLVTVDKDCVPHARWVSPGCLRERTGAIFMVSRSGSSKVEQLSVNPSSEMLFQSRTLDKILHVSGKINLLYNPSIRSEVLECIGGHLHQFWKIDQPESELVVLEFIIEKVVLYTPMDGLKEVVGFNAES